MLKKLILPIAAVALLGGCMTGGYSYQRDRGDYYYGQPSTDYRHYGNDGYYDYRYRGSYPSYYGGVYYGNGYRYDRYNRYPYGYYRPPVIVVRPGHGNNNGHDQHPRPDNDRDRAPWRDYERLQRERIQRSERPIGTPTATQRNAISAPVRPTATRSPPPRPASGSTNSRGSRMQTMMRKAKSGGNSDDRTEEK